MENSDFSYFLCFVQYYKNNSLYFIFYIFLFNIGHGVTLKKSQNKKYGSPISS